VLLSSLVSFDIPLQLLFMGTSNRDINSENSNNLNSKKFNSDHD
jgi:hypothetical protein